MISQPTNLTGFAPRDFEPMYPSLHRGLVGAWSMGHGPTGGTLFDRSGFGNHGTLTSMDPATDWVVDGGRYALDFDGSNDIVTLAKDPSSLTTKFTLSLWANQSAAKGNATFFCRGDYASPMDWSFVCTVGVPNSTVRAFITDSPSDVGGNLGTTASGTWTFGQWVHVVIRYYGDGADNSEKLKIYVSGIDSPLSYIGTIPSSLVTPIGEPTVIGSFEGLGRYFNGTMDDVLLYDRVLSDNEIWTLSGFGGNQQVGRGIAYRGRRRRFVAPAEAAAATVTRTKKSQLVGADGAVTDLSQKRARIVGL